MGGFKRHIFGDPFEEHEFFGFKEHVFGGASKENEFVGFEEHIFGPFEEHTIDVLYLDESGRRLLDKVLCAAKSKSAALL